MERIDDIEKIFSFFRSARQPKIVRLKPQVQYTQNLFGPVEDLQKGILYLKERNPQGDCLCLFNNEYLVDVDHRDIQEIV